MPKINAKISKLIFQKDKYTKSVDKAIDAAFRRAVRAFLKEAIIHVPVDTGMAAGSFLNIGKHFRAGLLPITPLRRGLTYYPPKGSIGRGLPKTPKSGAYLTTKPEEVLTRTTPADIPSTTFIINTRVWHYNFHDSNWGSFASGFDAFDASLTGFTQRKDFPKVKDFIVVEEISIKGTKVFKSRRKLKQ
jgi:hypothetical protein